MEMESGKNPENSLSRSLFGLRLGIQAGRAEHLPFDAAVVLVERSMKVPHPRQGKIGLIAP